MRARIALGRIIVGLVVAAIPLLAFAAGVAAKGTPSNITVTCGAGVTSATVTLQLMSGVASPTPASNQIVLACSASSPVATGKISPLSQPAAAYAWSAFVTATSSTFGCGSTTLRGMTATCTNDAGGTGQLTIVAS